jgi:hypothetical protein
MAKINLDIGHALSREDQRQNRRNLNFVSQPFFPLCFSPETARRSSQKKIIATFHPSFGEIRSGPEHRTLEQNPRSTQVAPAT